MTKRQEIDIPDSCLNNAKPNEMLFILMGRDPAAPVAIRAWVTERLRLEKNEYMDEKIRDALAIARFMEANRNDE